MLWLCQKKASRIQSTLTSLVFSSNTSLILVSQSLQVKGGGVANRVLRRRTGRSCNGWFNSGLAAKPNVQPANSHFPKAFCIRTQNILTSYKTQKHNSVIKQRTIKFTQTLSVFPWQKTGSRTIWWVQNDAVWQSVCRSLKLPLKNRQRYTKKKQRRRRREEPIHSSTRNLPFLLLQQVRPTTFLIGCLWESPHLREVPDLRAPPSFFSINAPQEQSSVSL